MGEGVGPGSEVAGLTRCPVYGNSPGVWLGVGGPGFVLHLPASMIMAATTRAKSNSIRKNRGVARIFLLVDFLLFI